jgi:hypothetical protein
MSALTPPDFLFCYLPIVLLGYAILGKFGRTPVVSWLAFSSLAFYAYWRPGCLRQISPAYARSRKRRLTREPKSRNRYEERS